MEMKAAANAVSKVGLHDAPPAVLGAVANQATLTCASQAVRDPPTRAQGQALNDWLVATTTLLREIRAAVIEKGLIKGGT